MSRSLDLKIVLLGNKNVGKTSLFNRFVYDEFGKTSMTIGAYFGRYILRCRFAINFSLIFSAQKVFYIRAWIQFGDLGHRRRRKVWFPDELLLPKRSWSMCMLRCVSSRHVSVKFHSISFPQTSQTIRASKAWCDGSRSCNKKQTKIVSLLSAATNVFLCWRAEVWF